MSNKLTVARELLVGKVNIVEVKQPEIIVPNQNIDQNSNNLKS